LDCGSPPQLSHAPGPSKAPEDWRSPKPVGDSQLFMKIADAPFAQSSLSVPAIQIAIVTPASQTAIKPEHKNLSHEHYQRIQRVRHAR
jgi:hypothetical protein